MSYILSIIRQPKFFTSQHLEKSLVVSLFTVSLIYNVFMLFYTIFPTVAVVAVSILYAILFLRILGKKFDIAERLFILLISLVPASFVSILGTSYDILPLSWFSIVIVGILTIILIRNRIEKKYLGVLLLFALFGLVSIAFFAYSLSASKQVLNILLFMTSFIIGSYFYRGKLSSLFFGLSKLAYIQTTIIFAITVIVQRYYIENIARVIGHYSEYALGRVSYSGLMSDFSFASLFVATGCIGLFFIYSEKIVKSKLFLIMGEAILLTAMVAINARTGLVALIAAIIIGAILEIIKGNKKIIIPSIIAAIVIGASAYFIYTNRGGQSYLDNSSRDDAYTVSLQAFQAHPLIGIGFGDSNYKAAIGDLALPHNFFIQYLAQAGIIGTVLILATFFMLIRMPIYKSSFCFTILIATFIGSMFVPDIISSRYLFVIVVLCMIGAVKVTKTRGRL